MTQITQALGYTGDMARQLQGKYDDLSIQDKEVFNTLMLTHPFDLRAVIQQSRESFTGFTATPISFFQGSSHLTFKNPESKIELSPMSTDPLGPAQI